jgi:PhnB protein
MVRAAVSLAPMLVVRRSVAAAEFYKHAFGAEELWRVTSPEGEIVAHFRIAGAAGPSEFWIHEESTQYGNYSPESLGGCACRMILNVADPDAMFARAVAAGAKVISEPRDMEYRWRQSRVEDPFGHHWEIGKQLD